MAVSQAARFSFGPITSQVHIGANKTLFHGVPGGPMTRIGTVEDTDSVCIARAVISHGASSGDPVTCKCTLDNVDYQYDLPKDESNGS